ncbi:MAG: hypothetical protein ABIT37_24995 [Luteolibacter sp.]
MKISKIHSLGKRGFALIVTLSLMILLTVVAVGLLSLSSISLRSTSLGAAQAVANSNAKLALMLAIGDLQKTLGPDQRISANAGAFDVGVQQPNLVGAWTSLGWKGPAGDPPSTSDKAKQFRSWLVSTRTVASATDFTLPTKADSADSIWLCNPATSGTIAPNNTKMRAERVPLTAGTNIGGLAWMVSDNSTKAPLNIKTNNSVTLAENVANRTAATGPRPDVLNSTFQKISEPSRVITMQTAVLAVPVDSQASIKKEINGRTQALTASSLGLLTNPVTGGLKTDLTPLMEGTTNLTAALGSALPYFSSADGGPSWNFLRTHYQLYKRVKNQAGGSPRFSLTASDMTTNTGMQPTPAKEVLLPVIAKLQIIFSLVSHYSHISDRVQAFNTKAVPLGNTLHAVPHLVYDPVITLYNPYDVELDLTQLRIRVSDPPVGFQFQKHDMVAGTNPWFRSEFATGEFHGLARFQRLNEHNTSARKFFTLYLRNKTVSGTPGGNMVLLPGEVKVFSPWVEKNWTWGLETSGGYTPRAFFDYDSTRTLGSQDLRTNNLRGVETIPGVDFRAGLQTDHLSYENGRPADSKYSWEVDKNGANINPFGAGWLTVKLGNPNVVPPVPSDEITVNAKPQRCVVDANLPDFRVDIMAGNNDNPDSDILRTYDFRLGDVASEMSTTANPSKIITRRFKNSSILQNPSDPGTGGKSPFAIFTMSAKTTKDPRDDSKAWAFNNMVTEGGSHDSKKIGNAAQSYDLRLQEITEFTTFPGVEIDPIPLRGYFGAMANAAKGVSIVPMYRVPITPAASLGDWIAANLITSSQFPRVNYPLGNSFAHPLIPSNAIYNTSPMGGSGKVLDHSYLMNATLWDGFFFSTATNYSTASFSPTRGKNDVLSGFFNGTKPMLNSRLAPYIAGGGDPQTLANDYASKNDIDFSKGFAKNAMIQGAFNVNSDSVDAWRAVLSSLRDASVKGYGNLYAVDNKTAFVRNGMPVAGSADDANPQNSVNALGQVRWAGFRTLTDAQIENLAKLIVAEIRVAAKEDSAPSLSLGDFVNRRLGSASGVHALKGILQTAIDNSDINTSFHTKDSNSISGASLAANRITNLPNTAALNGFTADGAAPMLTQGDLLTGLAPIIAARGDTFTIRCYGEARTTNGNSVLAKSWCEATVQRVPEYVDGGNAPETVATALTTVNQTFGRRFIVTSFRWLAPSEI